MSSSSGTPAGLTRPAFAGRLGVGQALVVPACERTNRRAPDAAATGRTGEAGAAAARGTALAPAALARAAALEAGAPTPPAPYARCFASSSRSNRASACGGAAAPAAQTSTRVCSGSLFHDCTSSDCLVLRRSASAFSPSSSRACSAAVCRPPLARPGVVGLQFRACELAAAADDAAVLRVRELPCTLVGPHEHPPLGQLGVGQQVDPRDDALDQRPSRRRPAHQAGKPRAANDRLPGGGHSIKRAEVIGFEREQRFMIQRYSPDRTTPGMTTGPPKEPDRQLCFDSDACRAHCTDRRVAQTRMVAWVRCDGDAPKTRSVLSSVLSSKFRHGGQHGLRRRRVDESRPSSRSADLPLSRQQKTSCRLRGFRTNGESIPSPTNRAARHP